MPGLGPCGSFSDREVSWDHVVLLVTGKSEMTPGAEEQEKWHLAPGLSVNGRVQQQTG